MLNVEQLKGIILIHWRSTEFDAILYRLLKSSKDLFLYFQGIH